MRNGEWDIVWNIEWGIGNGIRVTGEWRLDIGDGRMGKGEYGIPNSYSNVV